MLKPMKPCGFCNKLFEYYDIPSRPNRAKYCSFDCRQKGIPRYKFWDSASEQQKLDRLTDSFNKKVIKSDNKDDCWDWNAALKTGYGSMKYNDKNIRAHRLSWIIHNGSIPDGLCVLHKCDNRKCNNPNHLFLGSKVDNIKDMVSKGRNKYLIGETNGRSTITQEIVDNIKRLLEIETPTEIAKKYNISRQIVYKIKYKQTWNY